MQKIYYKYDNEGFYLEPVIIEIEEERKETKDLNNLTDVVAKDLENNKFYYKAKWDGEKWIEGATQEEIDAIENYVEPTPPDVVEPALTLEKLNNKIDNTMLGVAESFETALKANENNTNTNLALTEIFETMLNMQTTIEELSTKVAELENKDQ